MEFHTCSCHFGISFYRTLFLNFLPVPPRRLIVFIAFENYRVHDQSEDYCVHWVDVKVHPSMFTIKPRTITIIWTCSLVTFERMHFWWLFLDLQLTAYHSYIGVHTIIMFDLDMSTLPRARMKTLWNPRGFFNFLILKKKSDFTLKQIHISMLG